jgi:hypothetical protein
MLRDPKTGRYVYRLKGEVVNAETFWATALASTITNVLVILLAAKGLGISKRRAWALVAAANAWRAMNDLRVDVESTKPDRFEAARARAGLN